MKKMLCLLALTVPILADELPKTLTVDGVEYNNVSYQSHDAAFVKFTHDSGIATVPIEKLPAPLQAELGFDPAAAAERKQQAEEEKNATAARLAEKKQATLAKMQAQDADRQESVASTKQARLEQFIKTAQARIKALERQINDSVGAYEDRTTTKRTYQYSDGSSVTVKGEAGASKNIGRGGNRDSVENKARSDEIESLQNQIASAKEQLKK